MTDFLKSWHYFHRRKDVILLLLTTCLLGCASVLVIFLMQQERKHISIFIMFLMGVVALELTVIAIFPVFMAKGMLKNVYQSRGFVDLGSMFEPYQAIITWQHRVCNMRSLISLNPSTAEMQESGLLPEMNKLMHGKSDGLSKHGRRLCKHWLQDPNIRAQILSEHF